MSFFPDVFPVANDSATATAAAATATTATAATAATDRPELEQAAPSIHGRVNKKVTRLMISLQML
jgi:hypothetical protein